MKWGRYLVSGVNTLEKKEEGEEDEKGYNRMQRVLRFVEEMFRQDGASAFSSKMALGFLQVKMASAPEKMSRVMGYLMARLNGKKIPPPDALQAGCPGIIPGLRAQPFWDTSEFPWVRQLEEAFPTILQEFLDLQSKGPHFQPYRAPVNCSKKERIDELGQYATDRGDWNVCYLFLHDMDCFESNRKACPETVRILRGIPRQYNHALFSALAPETHVSEHYGPTNKKLRCHLPLVVPQGDDPMHPLCTLTVAQKTHTLTAGKCVIFDDSFLHEAANHACPYEESNSASGPRVVLILDVWHPDLSAEEVKFLGFLENAKMKAVKKYSAEINKQISPEEITQRDDESESRSFFDVIENAQGAAVEVSNVWSR